MTLLGFAALIGGIDQASSRCGAGTLPIQRANWLVVGAMTACVPTTAVTQFLPWRLSRVALGVALLQFGLYAAAVFVIRDSFVVIANYAPVMLLLLMLSLRGLGSGRGSVPMIAGIAIQFVASGVQASRHRWLHPARP